MNSEIMHPGLYVRENIIPPETTVVEAAKQLGIGRQALHSLLSGKASLSADLAKRIEVVFGCEAKGLLEMQAVFDAAHVELDVSHGFTTFAPKFLDLKSGTLTVWVENLERVTARTRFPVLLRTLVHSTVQEISYADFPGNDEGQRHGPDGTLTCSDGNAWVPTGQSTWEFGCGKSKPIEKKAQDDFDKKTRQLKDEPDFRRETTFVFVTPRQWTGAKSWAEERRAEGHWKDVRALEANDLEQWLAASPASQTWLAEEIDLDTDGVESLEHAYSTWSHVTKPPLPDALFDQHAAIHNQSFSRWRKSERSEPLSVVANSAHEALAFLHILFSRADRENDFAGVGLIFKRENSLSRYFQYIDGIIPIIADRTLERQLDPLLRKHNKKAIFVYSRGDAPSGENVLRLEQLGYEEFKKALHSIDHNDDDVANWDRQSGRHLTVLRRRMATNETLQRPNWARSTQAEELIPILFAGAWDSRNEFDQYVLSELSGKGYAQIEQQLLKFAKIEDAPVWSAGAARGIVSRIDCLYALREEISSKSLETFFEYAKFVLGKDDPAIKLPEKDRPWAAIYGKTRAISSILRKSMAEMLVLLSVHGDNLFQERTGFSCSSQASLLIQRLLLPLSVEKLESHDRDLALYAETSPKAFIGIIRDDLFDGKAETRKLIRPCNDFMFGGSSRTGLLSALQVLAWSEDTFFSVLEVLCELATIPLDDNVSPKPTTVLDDVFCDWMPQTGVSIEARVEAISKLANEYPDVIWGVMMRILESHRTQSVARKPIWRSDGYGKGNPLQGDRYRERFEFMNQIVSLIESWQNHSELTVTLLVEKIPNIHSDHHPRIWNGIERWAEEASDEERAHVREKIRTSCLGRRAARLIASEDMQRAKDIFEKLEPANLYVKHHWLFENAWVPEYGTDYEDGKFDHNAHTEWVEKSRLAALTEIFGQFGVRGIIAFSSDIGEQFVVGRIAKKDLLDLHQTKELILDTIAVLDEAGAAKFANLIGGICNCCSNEEVLQILNSIDDSDHQLKLLTWCPFRLSTWEIVEKHEAELSDRYWRDVHPHNIPRDNIAELRHGTLGLLNAQRPRAAFQYAHYSLEQLDDDILLKILEAAVQPGNDNSGDYLLDPYWIKESLKRLGNAAGIDRSRLAALEWHFAGAFKYDDDFSVPNLTREIEANPTLFVDLIAMLYRRDDNGEDPERLVPKSEEHKTSRAEHAYAVLQVLKNVPFANRADLIESEKNSALTSWCEQVLDDCKKLGRQAVGHSTLGQLLAHAPTGEDSVWPAEPVRSAFEQVYSPKLASGLIMGKFNSVGSYWRGDGGEYERERRDELHGWISALRYSHPRLAGALQGMADDYDRMAKSADTDRLVRKRIGYY